MKRCPEKEALKKFIEAGQADEMNEQIFSHLSLCSACRAAVRGFLAEEEGLLKSLFAAPVQRRQEGPQSHSRHLSKGGLLAYASHSLSEDLLKQVESHLETCDNCLNELMKLQKALALPADINLDLSGMAAKAKEVDLLEIVLRAKDNLLELIRHTGELLTLTPKFAAVRGKEQKAEAPIVIRKDFREEDRSIEIAIPMGRTVPSGKVKISIMRLSNEAFLSGLYVKLSSADYVQTGTTNEEGVVELSGISDGWNEIEVDGELVASLVIK